MRKKILKNALLLNLSAVLCAVSVHAEDVFIDCSVPNEQCRGLYQTSDTFNAETLNNLNAAGDQTYTIAPVARTTTAPLAVAQPYRPQPETLLMVNGQPVVQKSAMGQPMPAAFEGVKDPNAPTKVAALNPSENFKPADDAIVPPTAIDVMVAGGVSARPYEEREPEKEYNVKDMPNGSIVTQKETTIHKNEDGSVIEVSRVKETIVSPKYVEMPAISEVQRHHKIAYGTTVHDWEAPKGETLRTLLMDWGEKSGWTIVWQLERDYVLEAGVVFRGTFTDVASAILRTFARAMPAPVGTFYNGNRVLLITTQEDDNAQ